MRNMTMFEMNEQNKDCHVSVTEQIIDGKKYIVLNIPNDKIEAVSKILPGMKAPTITPLNTKGWSSLQSVIEEDSFWEIINQLKALGAEGILVVPIEKMIL